MTNTNPTLNFFRAVAAAGAAADVLDRSVSGRSHYAAISARRAAKRAANL